VVGSKLAGLVPEVSRKASTPSLPRSQDLLENTRAPRGPPGQVSLHQVQSCLPRNPTGAQDDPVVLLRLAGSTSTARFSSLVLGIDEEILVDRTAGFLSISSVEAGRISTRPAFDGGGGVIAAKVRMAASCCSGLPFSSREIQGRTAASFPREAEALIAARLTSRSESKNCVGKQGEYLLVVEVLQQRSIHRDPSMFGQEGRALLLRGGRGDCS